MNNLDLTKNLSKEELIIEKHKLSNICPDDSKYYQEELKYYLSPEAEWKACALVQLKLLETRKEFWLATQKDVEELSKAYELFDPLNASLIEKQITKHDQLAVIEELGRHTSEKVKALVHPWTTSYDILDTARSYLLKRVWKEKLSPLIKEVISNMINISERLSKLNDDWTIKALQVWRTHLQDTSPVPFATTVAWFAKRLADRYQLCEQSFSKLKWKISWIVWTWASIEMVIWKWRSREFEKKVLEKLWLEPDTTATQIVQKENLADVWHSLVTLMWVIASFTDDMRLLYSSAINEITSLDAKDRLGWSSADASKNNPINYENIAWKLAVVESGMRVLYEMIQTNLQRDLRWSVQARYQPQLMIVEVYESLKRLNRELKQLYVNEKQMLANLEKIRNNPSEALVAILRWGQWIHSKYWVWHNFVKEMAKKARIEWKNLIEVCLEDKEFKIFFDNLEEEKKEILTWKIEKYIWSSLQDAKNNCEYAKSIISKK